MVARILAILLALPPFAGDPIAEAPAARAERLAPYAPAIAAAVEFRPAGLSEELWAATLLELGRAESGFAAYVTDDRCLEGPHRCDVDSETGLPRARGAFQSWRAPHEAIPACTAVWRLAARDPGRRSAEAECASRRLAGAYYRCRGRHPAGDIAGAFAGYRSNDCEWAAGAGRAARAAAMAARLHQSDLP